MSPQQPPLDLPLFDRALLRAIQPIVPPAERPEWTRTWRAELWHMHHPARTAASNPIGNPNRTGSHMVLADLSLGILRDALWLRTDSWRRALAGTATLCLASLAALCLLSGLLALLFRPGGNSLTGQFTRSLFAAPLILFVAFATAPRRHIEQGVSSNSRARLQRRLFFASKLVLILSLAFLLSVNLCNPLTPQFRNTADLLQLLAFVLLALVGMRWALEDQQIRCKQCLRALATPARVGRPSHNLLEWNGTELTCTQGHGLLSVPEIETSWCQSSHWINLACD